MKQYFGIWNGKRYLTNDAGKTIIGSRIALKKIIASTFSQAENLIIRWHCPYEDMDCSNTACPVIWHNHNDCPFAVHNRHRYV